MNISNPVCLKVVTNGLEINISQDLQSSEDFTVNPLPILEKAYLYPDRTKKFNEEKLITSLVGQHHQQIRSIQKLQQTFSQLLKILSE